MKRLTLSRRSVLRGGLASVGVQVALPLLNAMAGSAPPPKRFGVFFWGNGVKLKKYLPTGEGADWALSEELMPLGELKPYINIVTGTNVKFGNRAHHTGQVATMTGADLNNATTQTTVKRASIDVEVAAQIGTTTRFKSLEIGNLGANTNNEGTSLQYISHNGPYAPNPHQTDPTKVFSRLFSTFSPAAPGASAPAPVDLSLQLRKSVLDAVLADITSLKTRLGADDVRRLDQHADNVRAIEKRLDPSASGIAAAAGAACKKPAAPAPSAATNIQKYAETNATMAQLLAMALACDLTRVFTYMYSGGGNHSSYSIGNTRDHHTLNHEELGDQPVSNQIQIFTFTQLAVFLNALRAVPEGQGNLLDNCSIACVSELSEGVSHSINDMPFMLAGRAGGALKYPGVHYRSPNKEPSTIAMLSAARAAGAKLATWGEGSMMASTGASAVEA